MPPPYRIQIVPDTRLAYFRETMVGAMRYGFSTGRLSFADRWLEHETTGNLRQRVVKDGIQGILAAVHHRDLERRYAALGIPVVNVSNAMLAPRLPVVTQDDKAVGRLAAEHLRACGCSEFAFLGEVGSSYSEQRLSGFRQVVGGARVHVSGVAPGKDTPRRQYRGILGFLRGLPRHTGLFAVMDSYALMVLRAARELGRPIPDDLLVLGAGDDDFLVELESVPLSSIRLPAREIGFEAARLLDQLITGKRLMSDSIEIPKCELVKRKSTDALLFDDPALERAMRHLREHLDAGVAALVRASGVSRSGLQQRFKKTLGRGMLEEIHHQRMELARDLLGQGTLKLEAVAQRIGLASVQRFSVLFRRHYGMPPGAFRRQQQTGHPAVAAKLTRGPAAWGARG